MGSPGTDTPAPRRPSFRLRRAFGLGICLIALAVQAAPATATTTWTRNLYASSAFLYQDPYAYACTAASTMIMLNTIAYRQTGGPGFRWTSYRVKNNTVNPKDPRDMTSILWFEKAHDTLSSLGRGSDPHGWRNALNLYGWGSAAMTDASRNVYRDLEYTSYDAAVHAAVRSIARFGMPVGIAAWAGRHAQVMTGYVVEGADPAISNSFTVRYVYISDPLKTDGYVNAKITNTGFKGGNLKVRFQRYRETDSPFDDGYAPGWLRSSVSPTKGTSEWYSRWVIIAPIRAGLPVDSPPPDPTPTPTPDPTPTATAGSTSSPTATPAPTSEATASPAPTATSTATPTSAASPSSGPDAPSTVSPTGSDPAPNPAP